MTDDDDDMIQCEPDPDDVKQSPALPPVAPAAAPAPLDPGKLKAKQPTRIKTDTAPVAVARPQKTSALAKTTGEKSGKQPAGSKPAEGKRRINITSRALPSASSTRLNGHPRSRAEVRSASGDDDDGRSPPRASRRKAPAVATKAKPATVDDSLP